MKFHLYDLEEKGNAAFSINEVIQVDENVMTPSNRFTEISEIEVTGTGFYDAKAQEFVVGLEISCQVVVPCAITLKPLDIELDTQLSEVFSFSDNIDEVDLDDVIAVSDLEVDLLPYILSAVIAEIPMKVVDPELEQYPAGEGWEVLTETALQKQKEETIDPRLEKLKAFKFED